MEVGPILYTYMSVDAHRGVVSVSMHGPCRKLRARYPAPWRVIPHYGALSWNLPSNRNAQNSHPMRQRGDCVLRTGTLRNVSQFASMQRTEHHLSPHGRLQTSPPTPPLPPPPRPHQPAMWTGVWPPSPGECGRRGARRQPALPAKSPRVGALRSPPRPPSPPDPFFVTNGAWSSPLSLHPIPSPHPSQKLALARFAGLHAWRQRGE